MIQIGSSLHTLHYRRLESQGVVCMCEWAVTFHIHSKHNPISSVKLIHTFSCSKGRFLAHHVIAAYQHQVITS